jgi:hypothetical protein
LQSLKTETELLTQAAKVGVTYARTIGEDLGLKGPDRLERAVDHAKTWIKGKMNTVLTNDQWNSLIQTVYDEVKKDWTALATPETAPATSITVVQGAPAVNVSSSTTQTDSATVPADSTAPADNSAKTASATDSTAVTTSAGEVTNIVDTLNKAITQVQQQSTNQLLQSVTTALNSALSTVAVPSTAQPVADAQTQAQATQTADTAQATAQTQTVAQATA